MSDASTAETKNIPTAIVGGPGRPDPARCSLAAIEALTAVAGSDMALTQIQLDVSSHAIGQRNVEVRAKVDKRTRSIVFASVEALSGEEMVFRAQALLSRKSDSA
jgi:hypothetical protein